VNSTAKWYVIRDAALAALCGLAVLCMGVSVSPTLLAPLLFAALLVGPGWAVTAWVNLEDQLLAWTVALATSLSLLFGGSVVAVKADSWHPSEFIAVGLVLSGSSLMLRGVKRLRTADHSRDSA
jgi:hypothetical protein